MSTTIYILKTSSIQKEYNSPPREALKSMPPSWMDSLLHWRPDRLDSECFVQEHVLADGFPCPRVLPRAERPLRDIPGLGESDRIVESNVEKHGPVVHSLEALNKVELVAMGVTHPVDP